MAISQVFIEVIDVLAHLGRGKSHQGSQNYHQGEQPPLSKITQQQLLPISHPKPNRGTTCAPGNPVVLQEGQPLLRGSLTSHIPHSISQKTAPTWHQSSFSWTASLPQTPRPCPGGFYPLGNPQMFSPQQPQDFSLFFPSSGRFRKQPKAWH